MMGEEIGIRPGDLVPDTDDNKMKILCLQLANQNYEEYRKLYLDTDVYNVYEAMTLINAINWKPRKT